MKNDYERINMGNLYTKININNYKFFCSKCDKKLKTIGRIKLNLGTIEFEVEPCNCESKNTMKLKLDKQSVSIKNIKEMKKKGYIFVARLPVGYEIYKKKNAAGGYSYFGESCGIFAEIYDDCISSFAEFLIIAKDCYGLNVSKELNKIQKKLEKRFGIKINWGFYENR